MDTPYIFTREEGNIDKHIQFINKNKPKIFVTITVIKQAADEMIIPVAKITPFGLLTQQQLFMNDYVKHTIYRNHYRDNTRTLKDIYFRNDIVNNHVYIINSSNCAIHTFTDINLKDYLQQYVDVGNIDYFTTTEKTSLCYVSGYNITPTHKLSAAKFRELMPQILPIMVRSLQKNLNQYFSEEFRVTELYTDDTEYFYQLDAKKPIKKALTKKNENVIS